MTEHANLLKGRHGIYYFRTVLPKGVSTRTGHREIRIWLRTKDRAKAKVPVAIEVLRLTETLSQFEPAETGNHGLPHPFQPDLCSSKRMARSTSVKRAFPATVTDSRSGLGISESHAENVRAYIDTLPKLLASTARMVHYSRKY